MAQRQYWSRASKTLNLLVLVFVTATGLRVAGAIDGKEFATIVTGTVVAWLKAPATPEPRRQRRS
jgi:hypothetical protein